MTQHISDHISLLIKSLSDKPGVYRFYDESGKILYVGKAKNLKRRVSSYFNKQHESGKIRLMVRKIKDIQTTVVDSEWEALLLENSMIKQYQPRFNAMLKDDKTYPWLVITKEKFPRVYLTRQPDKKKNEVYGPYASVYTVQLLLNTLLDTFKIRSCKYLDKNSRPCLQYQIKRCSAPCAGFITEAEYDETISQIRNIIKGNVSVVVKQLRKSMSDAAEKWEFEKAQQYKEMIEKLEIFKKKSVVVNPDIERIDVFSLAQDADSTYLNFLRIVEGAIVQSYTLEINQNLDSTKEELLSMGLLEIQIRFGTLSKEVIVPFLPDVHPEGIIFLIPQRGDKKKLLELSQKNAFIYMMEKKKRKELVNPERHSIRVLEALQKALGMSSLPKHIECFDNSNTQGEEPVAAMVCFINAKPAKKEYRHYNIKTVEGPDDYASMYEVVHRRYKRLLEEKKELPQLIIIDGGKGQLNIAHKAITDLHLEDKIMLIGIAERLEDVYKVGDPLPLYIDKKSEAQKLLQRIRDEVHRFGITHHRKRRSKKSLSSKLDDIPGIGKVLSQKLLQNFKSVKRIKEASEKELATIVGPSKAKIVKQKLNE